MFLDQVFQSLDTSNAQLAQGLTDMQGEIARLNAEIARLNAIIATPFETNTAQQTIVNRTNELATVIASQVPHA